MTEPTIIINRHRLTAAQAMAVRVAATHCHAEMSSNAAPEAIDRLYVARLAEVLRLMLTE